MRWALAILPGLTACAPVDATRPPVDRASELLATEIVEAPGHTGEGFRDARLAINGVRGGGLAQGSLDVFSLGLQAGVDDVLVLGWHGAALVDVDGPDLAVFENPFGVVEDTRFMDPVVVEVSPDGEAWVAFPFAFHGDAEWSPDPADWEGFAGVTPVLLHEDEHPADPLSAEAGGDAFDLAELPADDPVTARIADEGARYVRLSAAGLWDDPDTGRLHPVHPISDGPDIDGVYAAAVDAGP